MKEASSCIVNTNATTVRNSLNTTISLSSRPSHHHHLRISLISCLVLIPFSSLILCNNPVRCCLSQSLIIKPCFTFQSTHSRHIHSVFQARAIKKAFYNHKNNDNIGNKYDGKKNNMFRIGRLPLTQTTIREKNYYNSENNNNNESSDHISKKFASLSLPTLPLLNNDNKNQNNENNNNKIKDLIPFSLSPTSSQENLQSPSTSTSKVLTFSTTVIPKLLAITIPIFVIFTLAMNTSNNTPDMSNIGIVVYDTEKVVTQDVLDDVLVLKGIEDEIENIVNAALPNDATDLLTIALGEGLAGILGAVVMTVVNLVFGSNDTSASRNMNDIQQQQQQQQQQNTSNNGNDITTNNKNNIKSNIFTKNSSTNTNNNNNGVIIFNEALADSDYFLTRAAAQPLIGAIGMTGGLASTFLTVLFASVPYEIIKFSARQREQKRIEDLYLDALLEDELSRKKQRKGVLWSLSDIGGGGKMMRMISSGSTGKDVVKAESNKPIMERGYKFDFVEIFADVCKWLEYDVLMNDFGGKLRWASSGLPINSGIESAGFGFLAALSSQIYADVIYTVSDSMGTQVKRNEVRSRSINDYIRIYSLKCLSAATLFGVYEGTRVPVTRLINGFLSGGYGSCLGSDDFDFCLETYLLENPAVATPEAQLRSFAVALFSLFDRFGDIMNENVDTAALIRSLAVQFYSLIGFDYTYVIM